VDPPANTKFAAHFAASAPARFPAEFGPLALPRARDAKLPSDLALLRLDGNRQRFGIRELDFITLLELADELLGL